MTVFKLHILNCLLLSVVWKRRQNTWLYSSATSCQERAKHSSPREYGKKIITDNPACNGFTDDLKKIQKPCNGTRVCLFSRSHVPQLEIWILFPMLLRLLWCYIGGYGTTSRWLQVQEGEHPVLFCVCVQGHLSCLGWHCVLIKTW